MSLFPQEVESSTLSNMLALPMKIHGQISHKCAFASTHAVIASSIHTIVKP